MADVVVNATMVASSYQTGKQPGPIWTSELVGYWVSNQGNQLKIYKTIDGGATWPFLVNVCVASSAIYTFSWWHDKWTSGDSGTRIHIAWWSDTTPGTTRDGLWYRPFDTATDTFSAGEVRITTQNASPSRHSIVKSRGGYLYIASTWNRSVASGDTVAYFYRSIDNGASWVARTTFQEITGNNPADYYVVMPGNELDNQDMWAAYIDVSADEVSLKVYDDSANSWSESSVDAVGYVVTGSEVNKMIQASIRQSDGHMILATMTQFNNATGDIKLYDINGAASIVPKVNPVTDLIMLGHALTIDQNSNNLYIWYADASAGVGSVDVYRVVSSDGGASWDPPVQVNVTAISIRDLSSDWSVGQYQGRAMAFWYDDSAGAYTNTDTALDLLVTGGSGSIKSSLADLLVSSGLI